MSGTLCSMHGYNNSSAAPNCASVGCLVISMQMALGRGLC